MSLGPTRIVPASDTSLLLVFDDTASDAALLQVHAWFFALRDAAPSWLLELHPAYASLLVEIDPMCAHLSDAEAYVHALAPRVAHEASARERRQTPHTLHTLPVRYGGEDGPDILDVARHTGLTPHEVIAAHAAATYRVAFLGFSPGFAYLSGLHTTLAVPRRSTPRTSVPAGSVAIGGAQTAVYATSTPGGWNLIGRTCVPISMEWAVPGDLVRFIPVLDSESGQLDRDAPENAQSTGGTG